MEQLSLFKPGFNQDISRWNTSQVVSMAGMFRGATLFDADISGWDVSLVTNMENMFASATHFDQDLSNWDTVK